MRQIDLKCFPERPFQPGAVNVVTYGEDLEFELLGEHWHGVVQAAVKALRINKGKHRVFWGSIGGNYIAFPIIYNYRHVMELYLKGILIAGEPALLMDGQPGIEGNIFQAHSFQKLRPEVERVFDFLTIPYDLDRDGFRTKKEFRRLLRDMDEMEIRYPINTTRQPIMGDRYMTFNLFEFAEIMDTVLARLNEILGWIHAEVDLRTDQLRDYY